MIIKNLDNLFVPAESIDESKKFYQEILGLKIKFDFSDKGMAAFHIGDQEPAIILKETNKFEDSKPAIWFEVEDVQHAYNRLKEQGVHFLSQPFKIHTGYAVEFLDPSGNKLGLTDYKKEI